MKWIVRLFEKLFVSYTDIYVSNDGHDDNDGLSKSSPVLRLDRATDIASGMKRNYFNRVRILCFEKYYEGNGFIVS